LQGEKTFLPERAFANGTGFYEANVVPLFGSDNEVIGGFVLLHDITQKKLDAKRLEESKANLQRVNQELIQQIIELTRAQEEIRKNENLLKRTQQLAHIGTWVWNVGQNKIQWSGELSEIFEVQGNQEIASIKNYLKRVPADERKALYRQIREALKSMKPFDYEYRIRMSGGATKFIYGNGIPEVINQKLIITGFCQDITTKRKVIETLQSSENRFRTLCEKSPDAIFLMEEKSILYCNLAAVHLLKASSKAQVLSLDLFSLFPEIQPDNSNSVKKFSRLMNMAYEEEGKRFEWVHKKLTGENFWTEVILTPIQLEEKSILHVVWRDITLRKKAEQEVRKTKAELVRINNELEMRVEERTMDLAKTNKNLLKVNADLDNFIYTASHDLKAPISNIEGLLNEMIENKCYKDDEVKWLVDMMLISVDKFKQTIQDLTEVTQIQKMEAEDIHPIDIGELLEDIKFSIQSMISANEAIIQSDFSKCGCIVFSRRNLRSVMFNLISNALKYRSPERPPHIFISTDVEEEYIILSIRDNGLGLKDSDKEKVFSMFKRVHVHVEGSGVGLYIVKRIMENEGGKVVLESEEGVGSTFKLFFRRKNEV
ncbi:MAG: ATP-binding protein, partial [Candidatus Caenarcaniphilales bacterium]|nr:ATP-binding protein [Candidatus Caenarcaniphilales bacterium]